MDIFILGAGKPAHGTNPSALKTITQKIKAIDWQMNCFKSIKHVNKIHLLGGYRIEEIIRNYPNLHFTLISDWENNNILHTFLNAPFTGNSAIFCYADTIFRKNALEKLLDTQADITFGFDRNWKQRYSNRHISDIQKAETLDLFDYGLKHEVVEFTGLIFFNQSAINYISNLKNDTACTSLITLLQHLKCKQFNLLPVDLSNAWAEFNAPADIARFILGTKAETLNHLRPMVKKCHIGKQLIFTVGDWLAQPYRVLDDISIVFSDTSIIIRSSSYNEDSWKNSNAGCFKSILNINSHHTKAISDGIEAVISSYADENALENQVLIQEFIANVKMSGVVFTCNIETGAPYYRFNFDDKTNSTESVTAGYGESLRTIILSRFKTDYLETIEPKLLPVLEAVIEIETLLEFDKIDVEFAIDTAGIVHIFQVRPITVDHSNFEFDTPWFEENLEKNKTFFLEQHTPSPFVYGQKAIFANMPDWNPAEIIGKKPKPLAYSLYRYLITDDTWAKQRATFGYRDVRPSPLIYLIMGQPYVDARASLNSFIPASLPEQIASKLANAYISILSANQQLHDKIEFEVAFTIWTPNFVDAALKRLEPYGLVKQDIDELETALKALTRNALLRLDDDIASIKLLENRRQNIIASELPLISKIYLLIEDCKHFGTFAFAHAARAGFIAITFLNSFVSNEIFSPSRHQKFIQSIKTITSEFETDKILYSNNKLKLTDLLNRYGHLRQGTYELTNAAYWEDPENYFRPSKKELSPLTPFTLTALEISKIENVLRELDIFLNPTQLITYFKKAIQAREFVKFEFTRNLSHALDLCILLGQQLDISRNDMSFSAYRDLVQFKLNIIDKEVFLKRITENKRQHTITTLAELPPVIRDTKDFYCFERHSNSPNFVTLNKTLSIVRQLNDETDFENTIILIPYADPGYDWLFSHNISGLITQYGGANSHMAIRAAEMNLPAAIGVGEKLYERISKMKFIELDCANQIIKEVL
ncbi:MAG: hypothetical protein A3F12_02945 [Gammaproteobacteria bacterium RIFCSPHIGHO2_12_FULL_38_14]|nr:MAG: hypothetical protein A3F12_02945 [Gammaproteobacteria bacterium RIFCSPHIGHO2_12_FULL_38_14]